MAYILFVVGLLMLIAGGELLVQSGISLSQKLHLSPLIVGILLMGVGTSMPELAASLNAIMSNPPAPDIAFGNVIGSNISNVLFILGLAALIYPIQINRDNFKRDGIFIFSTALMLGIIMAFGYLDAVIGVFLLAFIAGYFFICYEKQQEQDIAHHQHIKLNKPVWALLLFAIFGIVIIIYGADLLVDTSKQIAALFGVPESVMGLTIIALGTSLPEVTVSAVAAFHRQSSIAFGNVVGSNIANVFLILGAMGVTRSMAVPQMWTQFWIMSVATLVLLLFGIVGKIPRWAGVLLLIGYGAYMYTSF